MNPLATNTDIFAVTHETLLTVYDVDALTNQLGSVAAAVSELSTRFWLQAVPLQILRMVNTEVRYPKASAVGVYENAQRYLKDFIQVNAEVWEERLAKMGITMIISRKDLEQSCCKALKDYIKELIYVKGPTAELPTLLQHPDQKGTT